MKAMILAAGKGTRLMPLTEFIPKALVKIGDKPMLELVIKRLIYYGFNEIIINVHQYPDQIKEFIDRNNRFDIEIAISDESLKLLGTGGGIKQASWFFNDHKPFMVHNVDVFSNINLSKLLQDHLNHRCLATLAVKKRTTKTGRYLIADDENYLCGWKNIKTHQEKIPRKPRSIYQELAFSGIQVIDPKIFSLMGTGQFSILDTYLSLCDGYDLRVYNHRNSFWMDLGTPDSITRAEKFLAG